MKILHIYIRMMNKWESIKVFSKNFPTQLQKKSECMKLRTVDEFCYETEKFNYTDESLWDSESKIRYGPRQHSYI